MDAPKKRAPVQNFSHQAFQLGEDVTEKLKILNYETEYLSAKNLPAFHGTFFAIPQGNVANQSKSFIELVMWLMKKCEVDFSVDKYDDPNTSVNKMVLTLKNMGFELEFPASKLRSGSGEAVCSVLSYLCDKAMSSSNIKFGRPVYPEEDYEEEADIDDQADAGELIDDIADNGDDGDVLYSELLKGEGLRSEDEIQATKVLESDVDPIIWNTELERVGPRLRVSVPSGGKEWRAHIEQTKKSEANISKTFPETKEQLVRIGEHIGQALERVTSKEKYINNQFTHLCEEYQTVKNKMQGANAGYQESSNAVTKLTNDLAEVSKKLDEVKMDMEGRGNSMTDTSPLVKIKSALSSLKVEIKTFELRIGVVGHTLMQAKMKMKGPSGGGHDKHGDENWHSNFDHDDDDMDLDDDDDDVGFIDH